ncbi:hypothetical protein CC1G_07521 [Coprinopsis cinerea okayama7|uniref:SET domain-containing protein n=1 Tax=Coprinopsis cinerea (strain Okayama-7 / 130 / ATCC MYA-4618 / FGSC 9003) TaxID=240176 RepID=A8P160_COPC7|nr:hypothetical protein CC1G_07521 [Coprinopsis cinerea okayama7\|eukprot:XP_001838031.1 hypothetical protein CC1G_07521 [Coprinopsis cinerea okayama7\
MSNQETLASDPKVVFDVDKGLRVSISRPGFGKLKLDKLPVDYERYLIKSDPEFVNHNSKKRASSATDNPEKLVAAVVPASNHKSPSKVQQRSTWIATRATQLRWFSKPGFPKPLPPMKPKCAVKETSDGMGLGVFATQDISRYDVVLVERPFLATPLSLSHLGPITNEAYGRLTTNQINQLMLLNADAYLEKVFDKTMSDEDRVEFMALGNSHTEDGSGPIIGRSRTNGFALEFGCSSTDNEFYRTGYTFVTRIGSRFNHSCITDVKQSFDPMTFAVTFRAERDIKAGQQIFLSYTLFNQSKAERQADLAPYGFECKCRACVNATPQSDQLRKMCGVLIRNWQRQLENVWLKDPNLKESVLEPIFAMMKRMEDEGLDELDTGYWDLLVFPYKVYGKLGMKKKEMEAQIKMFEHSLPLMPPEYKLTARNTLVALRSRVGRM